MAKNREPLNDDEKNKRLAALRKAREAEEPEEEEEEEHDDEDEGSEEAGSDGEGSEAGDDGDEPGAAGDPDGAESAEAGAGDEDDKHEALSPDEERRNKRRQEKKERREKARLAREADQNLIKSLTDQLNETNRRLSGLEKTNHQSSLAGMDEAIRKEETSFQLATQKMARAVKSGDDAAFAAAVTARDESRDRWMQLKNNRSRLENLERQAGRPSMPKQIVLDHARKFADENKWYDVQGRNEDSQIVLTIDQSLTNSGFSPETPQYWEELRKRVRKYLPHRYQSGGKTGDPKSKLKGKPGAFGSGMRSGSQKGGGVVLSKARQDAILALGIERGTPEWNDMVKTYQQYDKTQPAQNRR